MKRSIVVSALVLFGFIAVCFRAENLFSETLGNPAAGTALQAVFTKSGLPIYTDAKSPDNHYYPSGWMGDWGDLKVNEFSYDNPHTGENSIRVSYSAKGSNGAGWAGIFWQYPRNNWGGKHTGYNVTGAKKLVFWARGEKGGEHIDRFQIGGIQGDYPDTVEAWIGPVTLTAEWRRYEIDLTGKNLTHVIGGFMFVANARMNPEGFVFYLDDIQLE